MIFSLFLRCPRLNCVHSSMPKLKLSLTIKADDVKTGRKEVDPLRWLWAAQGANELIKRKYCKIKKYTLLTSTT